MTEEGGRVTVDVEGVQSCSRSTVLLVLTPSDRAPAPAVSFYVICMSATVTDRIILSFVLQVVPTATLVMLPRVLPLLLQLPNGAESAATLQPGGLSMQGEQSRLLLSRSDGLVSNDRLSDSE